MGRTAAVIWHVSFCVAAGVLYFFFVLPRTPELLGQTSPMLGTILRIVTGVLIGTGALPVLLTLLRTRPPEFGTPKLALNLRTTSIALHILAGLLIIGTAISEIWLSLDDAGQWLFGIYGAAAAITLLAALAFYLAFVAEKPPPPPKPLKIKERKGRRSSKDAAAATDDADEVEDADEIADSADTDCDETVETTEEEKEPSVSAAPVSTTEEPVSTTEAQPESVDDVASGDENAAKSDDELVTDVTATESESAEGKLLNRRPTGKGTVFGRRKRTRGGVAVED